jgi:hypothetical protein
LAAIGQWWLAIPQPKLSPRHTVRLVITWREHTAWQAEAFATAEDWRKHDKRIWQRTEHRRTRFARERLDLYRKQAKRIVDGAGVVVIDKVRLDRLQRQKSDTALEAIVHARKRLLRIAGASVLVQWIELETAKAGAEIHPQVRAPKEATHDAAACRALFAAWRASAPIAAE